MVEPEVLEIAEAYGARRLMLRDPAVDAIHLAVASYHRLDYVGTWNCRHLANANEVKHLAEFNVRMGLSIPALVTPHRLVPKKIEE